MPGTLEADLTQEWDEGGAFKVEGRCLGPTQVGSRFFLKGGHVNQPQVLHPQSLASVLPDTEPPSGPWVALVYFSRPFQGAPQGSVRFARSFHANKVEKFAYSRRTPAAEEAHL